MHSSADKKNETINSITKELLKSFITERVRDSSLKKQSTSATFFCITIGVLFSPNMSNIIKLPPISFSYRTEMRNLLSLLFIFGSLILVFQYTGIHVDDTAAIVPSSNPGDHHHHHHTATTIRQYSSNNDDGNVNGATAPSPKTSSLSSSDTMIKNSSILSPSNSVSVAPSHTVSMPEIPPEYLARKIYSFQEIVRMFIDGHRLSKSTIPQWSTKADHQLLQAKSDFQNPNTPPLHSTPDVVDDDDELYPPLYHNISFFKRTYESMEKTLQIYIYKEGSKPIFHQPDILTGTYAVEGWFMKTLKSNSHNFVTQNPEQAHLFYIPFSSVHLRLKIPISPLMRSYIDYLKNYLDLISGKYPYWNRTNGTDHFFTACHDWSEYITRDIMSNCIRAICDADIYNPFKFGKDISLPTTRIYGTSSNPLLNIGDTNPPPSKRKTLAFFAGQSHGYIRPILFHHFNNHPTIKVFGGHGTTLNGTEAYTSYMRQSKYCICPRGYASFGPRFMESIYFDCVPVLISDNYIPPFSDILDWEKFAVFVKEKEIPNLKEILMSIPEVKYRRLYNGVKRVKKHFVWNVEPKKYDVFHMILYSLWCNRVLQFQPKQ